MKIVEILTAIVCKLANHDWRNGYLVRKSQQPRVRFCKRCGKVLFNANKLEDPLPEWVEERTEDGNKNLRWI